MIFFANIITYHNNNLINIYKINKEGLLNLLYS